MSLTIPRSILIAGRKTSVRLENAFWVGLQEIADQRLMTLPGLIATIDAQRHHGNRSSALRLFVLEYYRRQVADAPEASSGISVPNPPPPRASRREGRGSGLKIQRTFRRERDFGRVSGTLSHMLNHDYLAQSLRRPLPTKDGGTLRTVADAANYIVALPEDRRRTHWDRTVQLLLDMADPSEISRQLEIALFYDRQLNLRMRTST